MTERLTLLVGDAVDRLSELPSESINTVVTSPPYYGLRDYGVDGQLGLEKTPDEYVESLVTVFREVRRVLRDDGTLWLNLGDSYGGSAGNTAMTGGRTDKERGERIFGVARGRNKGGRSKDLLGIPWRVAFALQADGWYLRQDIIWHKPNPMPESVRDRCTKAHEYVFLLSKSPKYYYDYEAVKEPSVTGFVRERKRPDGLSTEGEKRNKIGFSSCGISETRNRRSVWTVTTKPFKGAHFATFPPDLIEPCVLAGSPVGGTVLDPFAGSGTTGGVALAHGRKAVLIELNPEYARLVPERVESVSRFVESRQST